MHSALAVHEAILDIFMTDRRNLEYGGCEAKAIATYLMLRQVAVVDSNLANLEALLASAINDCRNGEINVRSTFLGVASSNGYVTCVSFLMKPTLPEQGAPLLAQFCHIDSPNHVAPLVINRGRTASDAVYNRHLGIIECLKKSAASGEEEFLTNLIGLDALAKSVCLASEMGHLDLVTRLTEFACSELDTTTPPFYFIQAMVIAAEHGHLQIVEILHDTYEVPLNSLDERGRCVLNVASANGHRQIVDYIVVDVNTEERYRLSIPLLLAVQNGHADVVRCLLDEGADIEARDSEKSTALMWAARYGYKAIIALLLERGAQLKARNSNGWTALMLAVYHKAPFEVVQLLLDEKDVDFNLNATTRDGNSLLILASFSGQVKVVEYLLENGANISTGNGDGTTPLIAASKNGHLDVVKLLLFAAQRSKSHEEFLEFLNERDNDGFTALIMAAGEGCENIVSALIQHGCDVNFSNKVGSTALVLAIENGQSTSAKLMIEAGANVNFRTPTGWTPLMFAARNDNLSTLIKLLVEKGAQVNATDDDGLSALLIAAYRGNVTNVGMLLDLGADVNICDKKFGNTCLILAARGGHAVITEMLLSQKEVLPLINKRDLDGRTALNIAKLRNFDYVARVLLKYGATS